MTFPSLEMPKARLLCEIDGVEDRDGADALRGVELYILREDLPDDLDDDEFYTSDLSGVWRRATRTVRSRV